MVKFDEFTFSLALLAFPGIIVYQILKRVAPKTDDGVVDVFIKVFVYSILSYLLFSIICWVYFSIPGTAGNAEISLPHLWGREEIGFAEILGATLSAVLLSIVLSYALTYNWINKFYQIIRASNRSGDKDLWTHYHNLPEHLKNGGWMFVRDHQKEIVYYGAIVGWSEESDGNRELIIADAQAYKELDNGETKLIYESNLVYLNRKAEDISIEVPRIESHERDNKKIRPVTE